jgi:hypothetical protein
MQLAGPSKHSLRRFILSLSAAPVSNGYSGDLVSGIPNPGLYPYVSYKPTVSHLNLQPKRGRSMAPRSEQVMLSCSSSLQGHSDFPTPITRLLPVSPDLRKAYHSWSPAETLGSQVLPPLSFTACHWPYPGSPSGAFALCFPDGSGLLPKNRGSACIPAQRGSSLNQTLPAITVRSSFTKLHHSLYAAACGFGKHPWLGKTRIYCEPSRHRVGASSARVLPHEPAPSLLIRKGN